MLLKKPWISKRYLKMNPHKRLLDLFNFRFKISVIFVYLLCCAQFDVKNDQVLFSVPASSQYLSRPSPPPGPSSGF